MKKFIILVFFLFCLTKAAWYEGIFNPQEADLTIVQGNSKAVFESKLWLYRTKGTNLAEGIAFNVSREEVQKDKDQLKFIPRVTSKMNDLDSSLPFIGIDFRLVDQCKFNNKKKLLGAEYSFTVRGAEENKNVLFEITVNYRAFSQWWSGMDMAKITQQMGEECLIRNKAVENAKIGYWNAAQKYFESKTNFMQELQSTDNKLTTKIAQLEKNLKDAIKKYENTQENAHKAASENKQDVTITYDVSKIKFDAARDNIVSVVPDIRDRIEVAHFEKNDQEFKLEIKDVKCNNCVFPN